MIPVARISFFVESSSLAMDRISALHVELFHTVDRLTDYVQHTTFNLIAGRHHDRTAHRDRLQSTVQSVGIVHSHATHRILADVLLHFDNQVAPVTTVNLQCIMNFWQHFLSILTFRIEINVDNRADNLGNVSSNL